VLDRSWDAEHPELQSLDGLTPEMDARRLFVQSSWSEETRRFRRGARVDEAVEWQVPCVRVVLGRDRVVIDTTYMLESVINILERNEERRD